MVTHVGMNASVHPLAAYRNAQNPPLTRAELGQLLGVSRITVWRWESGKREPDEVLLPRIREVTGLRPSELGGKAAAVARLEAAE